MLPPGIELRTQRSKAALEIKSIGNQRRGKCWIRTKDLKVKIGAQNEIQLEQLPCQESNRGQACYKRAQKINWNYEIMLRAGFERRTCWLQALTVKPQADEPDGRNSNFGHLLRPTHGIGDEIFFQKRIISIPIKRSCSLHSKSMINSN